MKSESSENDDLCPEYDFRNAVHGKHYKPLHDGYTVQIHQADGTTISQHPKLEEWAVLLDPMCARFSRLSSRRYALRSPIALTAQSPDQTNQLLKNHAVQNYRTTQSTIC